jgi:hypothetical protein
VTVYERRFASFRAITVAKVGSLASSKVKEFALDTRDQLKLGVVSVVVAPFAGLLSSGPAGCSWASTSSGAVAGWSDQDDTRIANTRHRPRVLTTRRRRGI